LRSFAGIGRIAGALLFGLLFGLRPGSLAAGPLEDGLEAYSARRYSDAAAMLTPLAEKGDPTAQVHVGLLHFHGLGVPESDATAFKWFSRAAEQRSPEAMFRLGNMYLFGHGVPTTEPDPDVRAAQWYFQAARMGHAESQYSLGLLFLAGKGVQQNDAEAMGWIRRAAAQDFAAAQRFLGIVRAPRDKPQKR